MLLLKTYTKPDLSAFNRIQKFVECHCDNNFFQSVYAFNIFFEAKNHSPIYLTVEKNGELMGVLLAVIIKNGGFIKGFFSGRCVVWGGPLANNNDPDAINLLLQNLNTQIKNKAIYTQFRNNKPCSDKLKSIFRRNNYSYSSHLNIIHDLSLPIKEQWHNVHKGRRKNINRAIRQGVIFKKVISKNEFDKAYALIKSTYKRIKLPLADKCLFDTSFAQLIEHGVFKTFVAVYKNKIISTRMVLCYNKTIYDWYAGTDENHLNKYPNDFMPWKIIEWGSLNGYKIFNFGGAGKLNKPYGVRDFKIKYGGTLVEHGRFEKIINKLFYKIGQIGIVALRTIN